MCVLLLIPIVKFFAVEIYHELFCEHLEGVGDPRYISKLPPPPNTRKRKNNKCKGMKLEEVLPQMRRGKHIRRAAWPKGVYCYITDGVYTRVVNLVQTDGSEEMFTTTFFALIEEDWEVVE